MADVGVGNFNLDEGRDYDSYLNLFEGRKTEKTLQGGSTIIIPTSAPISNSGPYEFLLQRNVSKKQNIYVCFIFF